MLVIAVVTEGTDDPFKQLNLRLNQMEQQNMADLTALQKAIANLTTDVANEASDIKVEIDDLKSQIANLKAGDVTQEQIDGLTVGINAADEAVKAMIPPA